MCDRDNFSGPGAGHPQRVPSLTASQAVYVALHVLAPRPTLNTDEVRYVCFSLVRIPFILGGLKVVKYVQYFIYYINYIYYIRGFRASRVLDTWRNIGCVHKRIFLRCALLIVRETRATPKMFYTRCRNSNAFHSARRARHTFAKHFVSHVRNVKPTVFVTGFTRVPSSHCTRQFC